MNIEIKRGEIIFIDTVKAQILKRLGKNDILVEYNSLDEDSDYQNRLIVVSDLKEADEAFYLKLDYVKIDPEQKQMPKVAQLIQVDEWGNIQGYITVYNASKSNITDWLGKHNAKVKVKK